MKLYRVVRPLGSLLPFAPPVGSVCEVEPSPIKGDWLSVFFPETSESVERRTVLRASEVERYLTEVESECES